MNDGLKAKHRAAIVAILAANDRVDRAVLFGSRTAETHALASDVDIALFGERLTSADRARLGAAIEEAAVPQRVDLILHGMIGSEALREHIERRGVERQRRGGASSSPTRVRPLRRRVLAAKLEARSPLGPQGSRSVAARPEEALAGRARMRRRRQRPRPRRHRARLCRPLADAMARRLETGLAGQNGNCGRRALCRVLPGSSRL